MCRPFYLLEDYIKDVLEVLPEKQKARFRYGQWVKGEGCIYDRFTEEMIIKPKDLPEMEYYAGGQDFGLNIAGVKIGYHEEKIYVVKDHGGHNITIKTLNDQLTKKGWYKMTSRSTAILLEENESRRLQAVLKLRMQLIQVWIT